MRHDRGEEANTKGFFYKLGVGMNFGSNRYERVELICGMRGMQNIMCRNAKNAKIRRVAPSQLKFRLPSVFVVAVFVGRGVFIRCGVFIFFVGICGNRIF